MKAILVINDMDIPKNCLSCPLTEYHREYSIVCRHYQTGIDTRPSWCPLKPMPKKLDENDWHRMFSGLFSERQAKGQGWNACLEEIEK